MSYKEQIKEFKAVLSKIGDKHGWTLSDIKERFSNDLYDQLILDDVPITSHRHEAAVVAAEKVGLHGLKVLVALLTPQQNTMKITTSAVEALESI